MSASLNRDEKLVVIKYLADQLGEQLYSGADVNHIVERELLSYRARLQQAVTDERDKARFDRVMNNTRTPLVIDQIARR